MAHPKTRKPAQTPTEQAVNVNPNSDGKPSAIDPQALLQLLEVHATKMGAALGEVIVEKLAALKNPVAEGVRTEPALGGPRESLERVEHALERAEDAWLAKYPPDDCAHLKCTDQELRDLEKTLEGPQKLLEEEQGDTRPPVGKIGAWQLPEYEAVPPDVIAKEECKPAPPASGP
jgi:hypothetical protein